MHRLTLLLLLIAAPANAQDGWPGRVRVSFNGGTQIETERLAESITLTKYVEPAPLEAGLPKAAVPFYDASVSLRLVGNAGVNAAASYLRNTGAAEVTAGIPHPFHFNQNRTVIGQVEGIMHAERAIHLDLIYVIASRQIDLALLGGASFFTVDQDFLSDVAVVETYPYDTATFSSAGVTRVRASRTGYNAGADVTWKLSRRWGLGGLLRYSRARVPFSFDDVDAGTVDVGGLEAGGGLRLMF